MSSLIQSLGRVAVGSRNPVKVSATQRVILRAAPSASVTGVAVPSGVRDQPWGNDETIEGARTRARAARRTLDAPLGIGIEGGVLELENGTLQTCAWAVAVTADGREGIGGSLAMPLPARVAAMVRDGLELGAAMDALSGERNTKHAGGAVGILTAGLVDRQQAYEVLVAYALAPFLSEPYWI